MNYQEITQKLLAKHQNVPVLKRLLKSMEKGFRPRSPNDADNILYVAVLLWVIGYDDDSVLLLKYVERNLDTEGGARNVFGSLAYCRLVLAEIHEKRGELCEVAELMNKEGLEAGLNLTNTENPLRECIRYRLDEWEFNNNDPEITHKYRMQAAYNVLLTSIIISRRFVEVEESATAEDKKLLNDSYEKFKSILKSLTIDQLG